MLSNELYLATDKELVAMQLRAEKLMQKLNLNRLSKADKKQTIIDLFGSIGTNFSIRPPLYCDYGSHIFAGDNLYINFDCTILDCNEVHIGNNVLFAPKVQIYTAYHPTDPQVRLTSKELAAPVTIGDNVWLGGGVIVCPGVKIGSNTTIGAGSVVTQKYTRQRYCGGQPLSSNQRCLSQ